MLKLLGEKRDVSFVVLPAPRPYGRGQRRRNPEVVPGARQRLSRTGDGDRRIRRHRRTRCPRQQPRRDAALRARYEQEKTRSSNRATPRFAHLIRVEKDANAAAQKAAEQKATQLAAQARQPGADFAALARANSDDIVSKATARPRWVQKGVMPHRANRPVRDAGRSGHRSGQDRFRCTGCSCASSRPAGRCLSNRHAKSWRASRVPSNASARSTT